MYIDLVVVRHKGTDTSPYLFKAPRFSYLKAGDLVEVETCKGTSEGTVLDSCTVDVDSDEYRCFALMAKMKPFKKVLKVYKAKEIEYEDENAETVTSDSV